MHGLHTFGMLSWAYGLQGLCIPRFLRCCHGGLDRMGCAYLGRVVVVWVQNPSPSLRPPGPAPHPLEHVIVTVWSSAKPQPPPFSLEKNCQRRDLISGSSTKTLQSAASGWSVAKPQTYMSLKLCWLGARLLVKVGVNRTYSVGKRATFPSLLSEQPCCPTPPPPPPPG